MRRLRDGLRILFEFAGAILRDFQMPSLEYSAVGTRCGRCRWDDPYSHEERAR